MARAFVPHHISDDSALGGSTLKNSLRFNKADNASLTRSPSSTTNDTKHTLSFWFKICTLINAANQGVMFAGGSDGSYAYVQLWNGTFYFGNSAGPYWNGNTTSLRFRDFNAWYHAVIVIDTTQSTANDRQKLYINGVQQERGGGTNPNQNDNYEFLTNSSWTYYIGKRAANDMNFDGYMADINFVQGLALEPTEFGYTDFQTGIWRPKGYFGSYNTNGFHLEFKNTSTDASYTVPTASFTTDSDTALLINNNESNGSTTFTDSSSNGYSVSGTGGVSHSTAQAKFGSSSIIFDGNDDSLSVGGNSTLYSELTASSNKTYEAFVYHSANDYTYLFSHSSNQQYLGMYLNASNGHFGFNGNSPNPYTAVQADVTIPLNQWNHFFVQRNADGTMTAGFNGSILQNSVAEGANNSTSGTTGPLKIGSQHYYGSTHRYFFEGYMDEIRISNTPRYSASYSGTVGDDTSGQGNSFTPNNFTSSDVMPNVPTNNFATFDSLITSRQSGGTVTYSEGNLKISTSVSSGAYARYPFTYSSLGAKSGKWYCEFTANATKCAFGITNLGQFDSDITTNPYGAAAVAALIYTSEGQLRGNNSDIRNGNPSFTTNDIIGIALDLDEKKIYFHKNGTYINSGNPNTKANPDTVQNLDSGIYVFQAGSDGQNNITASANFGQQAFTYTPPAGYKTLCSNNLPPEAPYIIEPQKHFDTVLYTGNGSSNGDVQRISSLQFDPDFVWIKSRSVSSTHNQVFDVIRSVGGDKAVATNLTSAEYSFSDFDFLNNGFNAPYSSSASYSCNTNSATYVAWCWKAGGAAVSNSDGTVASQVSANQKAGFSCVTYTGSNDSTVTFGHGLDAAPQVVFLKRRNNANGWRVYHHSVGLGKYLSLSNNSAETTSAQDFASVSATTFGVKGGYNPTSINGGTYVAYCFTEIPGYSKFDRFKGNNNVDGQVINLGFKPAWLMLKRTDQVSEWNIYDINRNVGEQPLARQIRANRDYNESGYDAARYVDFLSYGFKMRTNDADHNADGGTYIYMAFAEQPGITPYDTETNAR